MSNMIRIFNSSLNQSTKTSCCSEQKPPKKEAQESDRTLNMEILEGIRDSVRSFSFRRTANQTVSLGMVMASAFMLWKIWVCLSGNESPVVVVLTGSMEPAFKRGDILFLNMNDSPFRSGEIVVFKIEGKDIPIVHRVIKVHERQNTGDLQIVTKGDNNPWDDSYGIYADDQLWLEHNHMIGRVYGFLPYVGYLTIIMTEKPLIKYILISALSLLVITSKD